MYPNHNRLNVNRSLHAQSGNMIVMALFLIVVVALLSSALIKMVSASSNATIHQVYGLRAKLAAEAGIQHLLKTSFSPDGSVQSCNTTANSSNVFSNIDGLVACQYQAICTTNTVTHANQTYLSFKFSSTGSCQFNDYVVSRSLSVDAVEELTP